VPEKNRTFCDPFRIEISLCAFRGYHPQAGSTGSPQAGSTPGYCLASLLDAARKANKKYGDAGIAESQKFKNRRCRRSAQIIVKINDLQSAVNNS